MRARVAACRDLVANTQTLPVNLYGEEYQVEYLIIPPMTEEGKVKIPRFIMPGGGTDLFLCIEPALYSDRETIIISPLGYGKSSDIPDQIFEENSMHMAHVILQIIRMLGKKKIILSGHSNAGPIVLEAARLAKNFTSGEPIQVERVELINPLGLRKIPVVIVALAFMLSGLLTKIGGFFVEHPVDFIQGVYFAPKHPFSWSKWKYELKKSCRATIPVILERVREQGFEMAILVVLSSLNWGSFHFPWRPSDENILGKYQSDRLIIKVERIFGLHNPTLGPNSKVLAEVTEKSVLAVFYLSITLFPQLPAFMSWLMRWMEVPSA